MLAMGWEGYHLKEIRAGGITYFTRYAGGEAPEPTEGFPQRDAFQYIIGDLLKLHGDSFTFVYDMGDYWVHRVTLIEVLPCQTWDQGGDYAGAEIIDGQNACPPEDVEELRDMLVCSSHLLIQRTKSAKTTFIGLTETSTRTDSIYTRPANAYGISNE